MTKVLVFESDAAFAGELRTELARLGCTVQVVDDGNVGLTAAQSDPPQLILLSIELPRMNGFSVCNKLKKDAQLKDVPLIIMSSESSDDTFEQHKKLRTRAEDYVHKPIALGELLEHIRRLVPLGDGEDASDDAIVIDDAIELLEEDEETDIKPRPALGAPPPPVQSAPMRAASAPPPPRAMSAPPPKPSSPIKADEEIDEFIGDAFDRLMGDEEEEHAAAAAGHGVPTARHAAASAPPPPAPPPPPPPSPASPGATVKVASIPPPPAASGMRRSEAPGANEEVERLHGELKRAKDEIVRLSKESANANAAVQRLESDANARANTDDTEILKREVDDLRQRLASSGSRGGVSSKEFLDLREALNKKDKELISLRHEISKKDKEVIDLRDQTLSLEREKADQVDKILELERAKADLESNVDMLRADKDLANKRADDFKHRLEKTQAALSAREADIAQLKLEAQAAAEENASRVAEMQAEHAKQIEAARAARAASEENLKGDHAAVLDKVQRDHAAQVAQLEADHEQALADLTTELEDKRTRALEDLQQRSDQKLADRERELEQQRADALAKLRDEHESILSAERARHAEKETDFATKKSVLDQEVARLTLALEQTKEKLEATEANVDDLTDRNGKLTEELEATKKRLSESEAHSRELDGSLAIRTAERDELHQERDGLKGELQKTRDALEDTEEQLRDTQARLAKTQSELDSMNVAFANERARLEKARVKWGEDRASLERARESLTTALERIAETESRPLEE